MGSLLISQYIHYKNVDYTTAGDMYECMTKKSNPQSLCFKAVKLHTAMGFVQYLSSFPLIPPVDTFSKSIISGNLSG